MTTTPVRARHAMNTSRRENDMTIGRDGWQRRVHPRSLVALALAIAVVLSAGAVVTGAQEADRGLVLGRWEGRITFGESAPAVLEFSAADGTIRWTYSFRYDVNLWGEAEGTVSSLTPPALDLAGAWTKHAVAGARGTKIRFTLKIDGDRMNGTVTAEMNSTPVAIALTRKKN